jgi:hypothetical protein
MSRTAKYYAVVTWFIVGRLGQEIRVRLETLHIYASNRGTTIYIQIIPYRLLIVLLVIASGG